MSRSSAAPPSDPFAVNLPWPAAVAGAATAAAAWALITAPALGFYDAGELAAAAVEPGVPHPTGFPLLLLVGQAALLLPFGTLAGKIHALGAVAGVGAAVLWLLAGGANVAQRAPALRRPATLYAAALAAGLAAPAAPWVSLHLRQAEVYPLLLLWAAACAALWLGVRGPRRLVGAALLVGLGAGVHVEAVGFAGLVGLAGVVAGDLPRRRWAATLGLAAAALASGACCVIALPLVAQRRPSLDWGGIDSRAALLNHLSGASIRAAFADDIGAAPLTALRALTLGLGPSWPWLLGGALAAAAAVVGASAARRRFVAVTLALVGADFAFALTINPMGIRDGQVALVAQLGLGVLAVDGAVAALQRLPTRLRGLTPPALVALGAVAIAHVEARLPTAWLEGAARHGDALLDGLPPAALVWAASDLHAAACVWLQAAEGARPDVRCVPGVFARDARLVARRGERLGEAVWVDAAAAIAAARDGRARAAALGKLLRPAAEAGVLRWEPGLAFEDAQVAGALRPGWPLGAVQPAPLAEAVTALVAATVAADAAAVAACDGLGEACAAGSPLQGHVAATRALWAALLVQRAPAAAGELLERAIADGAPGGRPRHNLAVVRLGQGRAAEALVWAEEALAVEPMYRRAHRSAARAAVELGRGEVALGHARAAAAGGAWRRALALRARERGLLGVAVGLEGVE